LDAANPCSRVLFGAAHKVALRTGCKLSFSGVDSAFDFQALPMPAVLESMEVVVNKWVENFEIPLFIIL